MQSVLVEIPSIRDNEKGGVFLIGLAQNVIDNPHRRFIFNFRKCSVLEQNAVALFGGLARYVEAHNTFANALRGGFLFPSCEIIFHTDSMNPVIKNQLIENRFLLHFSKEMQYGNTGDDYIGYRQHGIGFDPTEIALHLNNQWLSDEKISISSDLKSEIVSRILEIFLNAYGHGIINNKKAGLGVTSCGHYNAKKKTISLTVVDFGCGIITNVQNYLKQEIDEVDAMNWALKTGNSTRTDSVHANIPRGLGFGLLSEFVSVNSGSLKIFSNSCYAAVGDNGVYVASKMKNIFNGTMINVTVKCDDRHYRFTSDSAKSEQFF